MDWSHIHTDSSAAIQIKLGVTIAMGNSHAARRVNFPVMQARMSDQSRKRHLPPLPSGGHAPMGVRYERRSIIPVPNPANIWIDRRDQTKSDSRNLLPS